MSDSSARTDELTVRGIIPPVVTPLTASHELDKPSLKRNVENLIAAGVDGLFPLGSTGEVAYFDDRTRREILDAVLEANNGRVPVFVGCIDLSWPRVVAQTEVLGADGVTAFVATSPIYAINAQSEIGDHFRRIKDKIDRPLIAYDVPVRSHHKLSHQLLIELANEGAVQGVKDSSGNDVGFRQLVMANRAAGSPLKIYTGHEVVCDGALLAGADGIVPGLANVDPAGYVAMWEASQAGDWERVRKEQDRLAELMNIAFQAPGRSGDAAGVGGFKTAMAYLGIIENATMADPIGVLDDDQVAAVRKVVDDWKAAK